MYFAGLTGHAASIRAVPKSESDSPLLQVAARNAFWKFSNTLLQQLGKYLGLELKGSLFQTLKTLVEHVLHGLSEEEVCEVLKVRVTQGAASQPLVGELLQMDETIEAMDHDEKHEMQEETKNLKRQLDAAQVFENEYRQLHAKVIGLARGKTSANPKNAKSPLLGFRTLSPCSCQCHHPARSQANVSPWTLHLEGLARWQLVHPLDLIQGTARYGKCLAITMHASVLQHG